MRAIGSRRVHFPVFVFQNVDNGVYLILAVQYSYS